MKRRLDLLDKFKTSTTSTDSVPPATTLSQHTPLSHAHLQDARQRCSYVPDIAEKEGLVAIYTQPRTHT